jgi:hypothetical protein
MKLEICKREKVQSITSDEGDERDSVDKFPCHDDGFFPSPLYSTHFEKMSLGDKTESKFWDRKGCMVGLREQEGWLVVRG